MSDPTPLPALDPAESERRRLARLRLLAVLDTAPEPVFDALVRVAATVCGVPIALISLIDADRQWFKANLGLEQVAQTPREVAFCDHAIRQDAVLEVADATRDARFAANPLVTGAPDIRFYAGAPITMPTGERIGTMCVIDREPGELTAPQRQVLQDLAQVAQWALLQRERLHDLAVVGDESRFEAISYASPLGIFQAEPGGAVFHVNGRLQLLLGLTGDQALGAGWLAAVHPDDLPRVAREWQQAVAGRQPFDREFRVRDAPGAARHVRVQARPARWGETARSGFVGVVDDISERVAALEREREAQHALRLAQQAAEAANRAKTEFLDNVSHEIRTPLNGVLGMTRLLLAETLTPQQRHYVQLADASAQSLRSLIDDLLDLSKIEAGRMDIEAVPFRLDELAQQLAELHRLRAADKGLAFELQLDPAVPREVVGDSLRLRQVLDNLLSNALKFTERGALGLRVAAGTPGRVAFEVHDTGIGIAPQAQQRLFQRFSQAESSTTRRFGGTGLGLAIASQLCERMGGGLRLDSAPGRGSRFFFELPLAAARAPAAAAAPVAAARAASGARLLVAEDNPTNQIVVRGLLAQAGYRDVTIVDDGAQAVRAALAGAFDLVLMDCRMPVLDGYQAAAQLRAAGFRAPIVALTANASAEERQHCLDQGMNDHVAKPIDAAQLARVVAAQLAGGGAAPVAAAAPAATSPVFDRAEALDRMAGDEELLTVAVTTFREHAPRALVTARAALAAGDREAFHRQLHSLSGSSGMVGAKAVERLARRAEADAVAAIGPGAGAQLEALDAAVAEFLRAAAAEPL